MGKMRGKFNYVSLPDMYHLMEGLTFNVKSCAEVLDDALSGLNEKTGIPSKIVQWNKSGGNAIRPLSFESHGRIIVDITESVDKSGRNLVMAQVIESKDDKQKAPVAFFTMRSISLDIPMRVEVPLRALIKGAPRLKGTYLVYLHALLDSEKNDFVYYGITKRGWSLRFSEHTAAAVKEQSRRLFPLKLNELIAARAAELSGQPVEGPRLAGIISSVCAIGLDENAAMDTEEYLVDKYSLSSKHLNGLNMIPGGREGIRSLHKLALAAGKHLVETEDREAVLDGYLRDHPQLGIPKPGVAEKWNDPDYAEAVICGRENRLSADQVREIRYLIPSSIDQNPCAQSRIPMEMMCHG